MSTKWAIKERYGDFEVVCDSAGSPHVLGEGTFGITVSAVRKRKVGGKEIVDRYALKILDPTLFESATLRAQFITELTSVQGINDSNLVRYIDYGELDGQPYVVMDICSGGDLGELVRRLRGPMPERLAARIGAQVAKGLRCMHEKRMVHRDIKPGNIMLACTTKPGSTSEVESLLADSSLCRIVDFGLINSTEGAADASSRRHFFGTLMYASPEQIRRRKDIDGRTDIYALGMTLWHLVKGSSPLTDGERKLDDDEIEDRHLSEQEHEANFPQGLSPEFRAILARMVEKDRDKRHRSATELGDELRVYLAATSATVSPPPPFDPPKGERPVLDTILKRVSAAGAKNFIPIEGLLEEAFTYTPVPGSGGRRFNALHRESKQRGRLTLEHLPEQEDQVRKDLQKVTAGLVERAWRINQQGAPGAFLGGVAVIKSRDALAWFEEQQPEGVTLAAVIKARTEDDRAITFQEAAEVFRQIAEALDHIARLSWNAISLPAEAVVLTCDGMAAGGDLKRWLLTPLDQWENLRVRFSGMCIPQSPNKKSRKLIDPSGAVTGSMSVAASEELRHPLKAFLRLVYHTRTGEVLIPAADRHAREYVQTDKMGGAANNLIKEQLSAQHAWEPYPENLVADISETLSKLFRYEGVSDVEMLLPVPFADEVTKSEAPSARPTPTAAATSAFTASAPTADKRRVATKTSTFQEPSRAPSATRAGTSSLPSGAFEVQNQPHPDDLPRSPDEAREAASRFARVVSPGRVRLGQLEQNVSPGTWGFPGPFGDFVRCASTQTLYSLPRHRSPLIGTVIAPHLVVSPFVLPATDGTAQQIAWADWKPGNKINCKHTHEDFLLPLELIYPEGILPAQGTGRIISPYDESQTAEEVDPAGWIEGNKLECLATGQPLIFMLPRTLPPLEATAEADKPGVFGSPYPAAGNARTQIESTKWFSGTVVQCPKTSKPLTLPAVVDQWIAEAVVEDAAARLVLSPYFENEHCEVTVRDWKRGGNATCARSRRTMRLPRDLPLLVGTVIPNRVGAIISPYTGGEIEVKLTDWITGREVAGAAPEENFLLPPGLPVPEGSFDQRAPGFVRSPYLDATAKPLAVPPLQWIEGTEMVCEKTRAPFKLPKKLPLLHGILTGEAGSIRSPYPTKADEAVEVEDINDWVAGKVFDCPSNPGRVFALPPDIEEWIMDGTFVHGVPGRVHSPFQNGGNVDLTEADWKPGALVECPVAKRRFRVPVTKDFPTLALEKAAVQRALTAEPEKTEQDAAEALKKEHKGATAAAILAIWTRHDLDTPEKRGPKDTGSLIDGRPGFVISPYTKEETPVEPQVWVQPRASMLCTSGRRFLLPADRPHLVCAIDTRQPGTVTSPFAPDKPFEVRPWQWKDGAEIKCERSGHVFVLPKNLPAWVPEARLVENTPGTVINPFSPDGKTISIDGPDWKDENILNVGGKQYKLPRNLPPLVARNVNAKGAEAESPYAPGKFTHVEPDQWVEGSAVVCKETRRTFVLPANLPAPVFAGTDPRIEDATTGSIQSPYGKKQRFNVDAADWEEGKDVRCPESKKRVVLPKGLPLLVGKIDPEAPCKVLSPFVFDGKWMDVDIGDWIEGREIKCVKTQRAFALPHEKLPAPIATLLDGKPGIAISPFNGEEITVPPMQWIESGEIKDRKTGRLCRLPKKLPLLEGSPVGRTATVKSPFDSKKEVRVPGADWRPGHVVTCPATGRTFALPQQLPELVGIAIADKLGFITDPYTGDALEVFHSDWKADHIIASPEGRLIALDTKLPPLIATVLDGGNRIRSPYDLTTEATVKREKDWVPGGIVKCGDREVQLPSSLRPWITPDKRPFPWAAVIGITTCLAIGGGAWMYWKSLPPKVIEIPGIVESTDLKAKEDAWLLKRDDAALAKVYLDGLKDEYAKPETDAKTRYSILGKQFEVRLQTEDYDIEFLDNVIKTAANLGTEESNALAEKVIDAARKSERDTNKAARKQAVLEYARGLDKKKSAADKIATAYIEAGQRENPEAVEWLTANISKLTAPLFESALAALNLGDRARLVSAGTKSEDKAIAAKSWFITADELMQDKKDDKIALPEVRQAFFKAAELGNESARKTLTQNVEAIIDPSKPLKITLPYAEAKLVTLKRSEWKDGKELPEHWVKLPTGLPGLLAVFDDKKHTPPIDTKPGIVSDPYNDAEATINVPRDKWYRLATLDNPKITLPENLRLMNAIIDERIMKWIDERKAAWITSPVSGAEVPVSWELWKPGTTIKEKLQINGAEVEREVAVMPPDVSAKDPKLAADGTTAAKKLVSAPEEHRFAYTVVSPYTGQPVTVPVTDWVKGGPVPEAALKTKGVQVTMLLPAKREVWGWISKERTFSYIDEAGQKDVTLPRSVKTASLIKDGFTLEDTGPVFRLDAKPEIFRDEKNDIVNKLTGEEYSLKEVVELSRDPLLSYSIESKLQSEIDIYRQTPKETNAPKDPDKMVETKPAIVENSKKPDPDSPPPAKKETSLAGKAAAKPPAPETSKKEVSKAKSEPAKKVQDQPPSGSTISKSFYVPGSTFGFKNGVAPGANNRENGTTAAKDLTSKLRSSGKLNKGEEVQYDSRINGYRIVQKAK